MGLDLIRNDLHTITGLMFAERGGVLEPTTPPSRTQRCMLVRACSTAGLSMWEVQPTASHEQPSLVIDTKDLTGWAAAAIARMAKEEEYRVARLKACEGLLRSVCNTVFTFEENKLLIAQEPSPAKSAPPPKMAPVSRQLQDLQLLMRTGAIDAQFLQTGCDSHTVVVFDADETILKNVAGARSRQPISQRKKNKGEVSRS